MQKKSISYVSQNSKPLRAQRHINIKITKAYLTYGVERNHLHTGRIYRFAIKIEEVYQFYHLAKGSSKIEALVNRGI